MPTHKPLMIRPTINMPMFCDAQTMVEPMHLGVEVQSSDSRCAQCGVAEPHSPDDGADHDGLLPPQDVREKAGDQSTEPGATGHGGGDAALDARTRTGAVRRTRGALIEVTQILFGSDDGGHGRDVEAEQATANDGYGRDEVDVPNRHGCKARSFLVELVLVVYQRFMTTTKTICRCLSVGSSYEMQC